MKAREIGLCAALAAAVALGLWWRAPAPVHSDFCSYYSAGRLTLDGRAAAAYDAAELERTHRALHDIGRRAGPYLYSPLLLLPSAAFATAPLPAAAALDRALGASALGAGLLAVLLALEGWLARLAVAAAFALAHAVSIQLAYENWSFLLFALAAGAALALRRGKLGAAGVLAAAAIHLKAFVVFAFLPLAAGARRRVLAWVAGAGVALALASLPAVGLAPWKTFADFLASRSDGGVTPFYSKCSLAANVARISTEPREWVAARAPVESWPVRALFWAGLPVAAWGSWKLRRAPEPALAFGIAWTLLFVPQIWEHTEILLFAALPALAPRWRLALALLLAATYLYGPAQQDLLRRVLDSGRPAGALAGLLLLYPVLNLLVAGAALASPARSGKGRGTGARAA